MLLKQSIIFTCLVTFAVLVSAESENVFSRVLTSLQELIHMRREGEFNEASHLNNAHHVSIRFDGKHHCSGSIISNRYILTSSACVRTYGFNDDRSPKRITVMAGIDSITSTGDEYEAESMHAPNDTSNICLIRTRNEILHRPGVNAIRLADYKTYPDDSLLKIIAWDHAPLEGVSGRGRLQEYVQKLYNKQKCQQQFEWNGKENLCTYDPTGKGLCHTDAGGGIVVNGYLIGIHSNAAECFDGGEPKAHTPISSDLNWITQTSDLIAQPSPAVQLEADRWDRLSSHNKHPYLVVIRSADNKHICSGSIINKRHILTSHICVASHNANDLYISAGVTSLNEPGHTYRINRIIPHEEWNVDIAILRVTQDIVFNENVNSIPIIDNSYVLYDGKSVMLVGYERPIVDHTMSDKMKQYTLQILNREKCMETIPFLEQRYMCSINSSSKRSCYMDDGSPVVANGIQVAMQPSSVKCGDNIHVHLSLYDQASWITENSRMWY